LNTNGVVDPNLIQDTGLNSSVYAALGTSDNKLLAGGAFTLPEPGVTRLQVNGALDISFNTGAGITNGNVWGMLLVNGQVIVAGAFTEVDHVPRTKIARLNANGTVDLTYVPPTITGGTIYALAPQTDNKLIVAGDFTNVNGVARSRLLRLNTDGSLDTNFMAVVITNGIIYALALQPDGKILAAGSFTSVNGRTRTRIARFYSDGSLDLDFDAGVGPNNTVYAIGLQRDGRVIIGGSFTSVNGITRNGLARLRGDPTTVPNIRPGYQLLNGAFTITWDSQAGRSYIVEASTNMVNWTQIQTVNAVGATASYTDTSAASFRYRFYRTHLVSP
jgi:uncharacterized delta-60 repeat protein